MTNVLKTEKKTPITVSSHKLSLTTRENPDWICFTVSYTSLGKSRHLFWKWKLTDQIGSKTRSTKQQFNIGHQKQLILWIDQKLFRNSLSSLDVNLQVFKHVQRFQVLKHNGRLTLTVVKLLDVRVLSSLCSRDFSWTFHSTRIVFLKLGKCTLTCLQSGNYRTHARALNQELRTYVTSSQLRHYKDVMLYVCSLSLLIRCRQTRILTRVKYSDIMTSKTIVETHD